MTFKASDTALFDELNQRFADSSPREILTFAVEAFGNDLAMATGFGPSGVVLMHLASKVGVETIFYLDTGLFFPETYRLRDTLSEQLQIQFTRVTSELSLEDQEVEHGPSLWKTNSDHCCFIRKVLPLRNFLKDKKAWVTGLRRDQGRSRASTEIFSWDSANNLVKINPLAHWTSDEVWGYINIYDLPYNPLHDQGYPSVGCMPCTRAVAADEDVRAGRWAGQQKMECGIHLQSDSEFATASFVSLDTVVASIPEPEAPRTSWQQLWRGNMWGYWDAGRAYVESISTRPVYRKVA